MLLHTLDDLLEAETHQKVRLVGVRDQINVLLAAIRELDLTQRLLELLSNELIDERLSVRVRFDGFGGLLGLCGARGVGLRGGAGREGGRGRGRGGLVFDVVEGRRGRVDRVVESLVRGQGLGRVGLFVECA